MSLPLLITIVMFLSGYIGFFSLALYLLFSGYIGIFPILIVAILFYSGFLPMLIQGVRNVVSPNSTGYQQTAYPTGYQQTAYPTSYQQTASPLGYQENQEYGYF